MSNDPLALAVEGIKKQFGQVEVLKGISVQAAKGDVIAILGASGSGKSTFLRCINLLETPNAGRIVVAGEEIAPEARQAAAACSQGSASSWRGSAPSSPWCSRASISGRT